MVVVGSVLTFLGIVKISEIDFKKSEPQPVYIAVDGETLSELRKR